MSSDPLLALPSGVHPLVSRLSQVRRTQPKLSIGHLVAIRRRDSETLHICMSCDDLEIELLISLGNILSRSNESTHMSLALQTYPGKVLYLSS